MSAHPTMRVADWACWSSFGWESACEASVQRADDRTRGQAKQEYLLDCPGLDYREVKAWKRWIAERSRQQMWDAFGREREALRALDESDLCIDVPYGEPAPAVVLDLVPVLVPDDWEPDGEGDCTWTFVEPRTPGAEAVWVLGGPEDTPPGRPAATAASTEGGAS